MKYYEHPKPRTKTRRILSLAFAVLLVFTLVSCSNSDNNSSLHDNNPSPTMGLTRQENQLPAEDALYYDSEIAYSISKDMIPPGSPTDRYVPIESLEEYDELDETSFKKVLGNPLSTFSSDVDTASYSNMRRFINNGREPEGVRTEELINYFDYSFPKPNQNSAHPFAIHTEVSNCPWQRGHGLAMITITGAEMTHEQEIANNIVFLLDVSGSMDAPNKLPLLQQSLHLFIEELGENDRISIVTYAGSDKIIADSIPGNNDSLLREKVDGLWAGGSTAGAAGITTAYELAEKNFIPGGNNRIILATDGDFNVGISSNSALESLIEEKRESGVFITVLGFGMYNLKDSKMETIADKGNGNYAYIDTLQEAEKVLVREFNSTMYTIAKDVKFQIEFNPDVVSEYRLIGYENRRLENEDFANDKKDAGDIGAGHTVTAFYELKFTDDSTEDAGLKYQNLVSTGSDEIMTVSVRYKNPGEDTSILTEKAVGQEFFTDTPSADFRFAAAVTEFALIVKDSDYCGSANLAHVQSAALDALGEDPYGLREEFVSLVKAYQKNVSGKY